MFGAKPQPLTGLSSFPAASSASTLPTFGGGSTFGQTQPTAFQLPAFGSQQPAAAANPFGQQQQQVSVQQLIQDPALFVKSLAGPELCNDDRDGVVAKLNQLQASLGIGQGYYRDGQAPINYDTKNPYYQFKGAVYNRLCQNSDTDGIVVLLLNVPPAQLNSLEGKPKLTTALNNILGAQLGLNVIVERIKTADQNRSEVVIYACEKGGRIPALTLFKFLSQPDKQRLLEQQLACQKIVPLVELSKADKEKFLKTPPDGFDQSLWRQYVNANPNPDSCLPQPIYGFAQLLERQQMQQVTDVVQKTIIEENDLRQGYAMSKVEDRMLAQAEHASANLLGPNALKDRINDILKLVESDRPQILEYFNNVDVKFTPEEEQHVRQQLQVAQNRLEKVNGMLAEVRKITDHSTPQEKKPQTHANSPSKFLYNRLKAAGVNPVDTYIRSGTYALKPDLPYVPGREGAGVVEQVGPNVQQFKPGDRVWFAALRNGAAAEFAAIDADFVFRLPNRVSFAQGATLGIAYFTAYRALFLKAGAQAGQSLFVHGASGGVGLAACQLGKSHGLRVFGTASTPEGEALAREHGCEEVFNHREEGYVERIRERYPLGFDIIVEMLANVNLCADLQLIAPQGRIVVVGNRGTIEIDPRQCMQKEAAIIGLMASVTTPEDYQRMGERVVGLLEGGHVTPNVGQTFPLEQLGEAHRRILEPGARGKIVVLITPDAEAEAQGEGEPQP
ncbi:Quinone oxidoreductase-like isoform X2 [Aphelenchoides fujianensis]|nr:Quinone oxidoreductase-like isoform X2 [Aphelenchoides fujianensis]